MKEFVLLFRLSDISAVKPTPEQIHERMNWLEDIAAQGKLSDRGKTLLVQGAKTIKPGGVVNDGPSIEISEFVSGFMIVKSETIEEAVEIAKLNPIYKIGGTVEVREVMSPITKS